MMKNSFSNLGYTLGGGNLYKQYASNKPPNFSYLPVDTSKPSFPNTNDNNYNNMQQGLQSGGLHHPGIMSFSDMASPTGMTPPAMTYGSQLFTNLPPSASQNQPGYFAVNTSNSVMQGQPNQTAGNQSHQQATISVLPPDCNPYFSDQAASNAAIGCHVNVGNKEDRPIVYVKPGEQDGNGTTQSVVNAQGDGVMTNPMANQCYSPAPNAQNQQQGDTFSYGQGQAPSHGQQQPLGQNNYMQTQYPSAVIGSSNTTMPQQPIVFQMPGMDAQQGQINGAQGQVYQVSDVTGQPINSTSQQNGANPVTQSRPTKKYVPCGSCRACKFAGPKPPVSNTRQPYLVRQQRKS